MLTCARTTPKSSRLMKIPERYLDQRSTSSERDRIVIPIRMNPHASLSGRALDMIAGGDQGHGYRGWHVLNSCI